MEGGTGLAVEAALFRMHREQPLLGAQPPDTVLADHVAGVLEVVGDEAVPGLGVVVVQVDRGVGQVRIVEITTADRRSLPLAEGLGGEAQHPAGHRHRHPDGGVGGGQFKDQRVGHFGLMSRERYATARRITSASCSEEPDPFLRFTQLGGLSGGETGTGAFLDVGFLHPVVQTAPGDPEVLRDLGQRSFALAGDRDDVAAELGG